MHLFYFVFVVLTGQINRIGLDWVSLLNSIHLHIQNWRFKELALDLIIKTISICAGSQIIVIIVDKSTVFPLHNLHIISVTVRITRMIHRLRLIKRVLTSTSRTGHNTLSQRQRGHFNSSCLSIWIRVWLFWNSFYFGSSNLIQFMWILVITIVSQIIIVNTVITLDLRFLLASHSIWHFLQVFISIVRISSIVFDVKVTYKLACMFWRCRWLTRRLSCQV